MKKFLFIAFLFTFSLTLSAVIASDFCCYEQLPVSSVSDVLKMNDDRPVVLKGHIVKKLLFEKYKFADKTGSIVVDIDDDLQNFIPSRNVEIKIYGTVDKDKDSIEVEVESIHSLGN